MCRAIRRWISVGLATAILVLATAVLGQSPTPQSAKPPIAWSGTIILSGHRYECQAEYWGDDLAIEYGRATRSGLHDVYLAQRIRQSKCRSLEELYRCYTPESRPWLDESKDGLLRSIEFNSKNSRIRGAMNLYLVVLAKDAMKEHLFLVRSMGGFMPAKEAGPDYTVTAMTHEGDEWKFDLGMASHPLNVELSQGRWKQFGAPQDMGNQQAMAEMRAIFEAKERASATQPATKPSAPKH